MASTTDLKIIISAVDNASSSLKGVSSNLKAMSIAAGVAGAAILGGLALSVKAAADSQSKMTSLKNTIDNTVGSTINVLDKQKEFSTSLKETSLGADKLKSAIESAKTSIQSHQVEISKLNTELSKGKITHSEYTVKVQAQNDAIKKASLSIQEYNDKLTATSTKTSKLVTAQVQVAGSAQKVFDTFVAAARSQVSLGFNTDDLANSMGTLYQRTGNVQLAIQLSNAAMDLATRKHIDLSTATTYLQQALNGSGKALALLGIPVKDLASPLEVLAAVEGKVGGAAKDAAANDFDVKMAALNEEFRLFQVQIGNVLLPLLSTLLQKIQPILLSILDWTQKHQALTAGLVIFATIVGGLLTALALLAPAILLVSQASSILAGVMIVIDAIPMVLAIMGIIAALALLFAAVYYGTIYIEENFNSWYASVSKFCEKAIKLFTDFWAKVVDGFHIMVDSVVKFFQPLIDTLDNIIGKLSQIASGVGGKISGAISSVGSFISGKRAAGGPVSGGSTYLVGERGPELFTPSAGGNITPNGALAGAGGVNIVVDLRGSFGISEGVAQSIGDAIISRWRRVGGKI